MPHPPILPGDSSIRRGNISAAGIGASGIVGAAAAE
jgi:hypothetical protein